MQFLKLKFLTINQRLNQIFNKILSNQISTSICNNLKIKIPNKHMPTLSKIIPLLHNNISNNFNSQTFWINQIRSQTQLWQMKIIKMNAYKSISLIMIKEMDHLFHFKIDLLLRRNTKQMRWEQLTTKLMEITWIMLYSNTIIPLVILR